MTLVAHQSCSLIAFFLFTKLNTFTSYMLALLTSQFSCVLHFTISFKYFMAKK